MTTNDIISHRLGARAFYACLKPSSINETWREPLKLRDLLQLRTAITLPSGLVTNYCHGVCYACVLDLLSKYNRKNKPDPSALDYMSRQIFINYPDWSVTDLPTFVNMCVSARIPTTRAGTTEYELFILDIPSILGKLEAYDKMRPRQSVAPVVNSTKPAEKPLSEWQLHHKMDRSEYEWPSYEAARKYWKSLPDMNDPAEKKFIDSVGEAKRDCCEILSSSSHEVVQLSAEQIAPFF